MMTFEEIQAVLAQTAQQSQATQQQVDANARAFDRTNQQIQATQQQVNANARAIDQTNQQIQATQQQVNANTRAIARLEEFIEQTNHAVDALVGVSSGLMTRLDGLIERLDRGQATAEIQADSIRELVRYLNRSNP